MPTGKSFGISNKTYFSVRISYPKASKVPAIPFFLSQTVNSVAIGLKSSVTASGELDSNSIECPISHIRFRVR